MLTVSTACACCKGKAPEAPIADDDGPQSAQDRVLRFWRSQGWLTNGETSLCPKCAPDFLSRPAVAAEMQRRKIA